MQANYTYNDVLAIVCAELQKMFPKEGPITATTDMTKDLPLDSAGTMTLVFELENKLDVSLPLNELANISQVHELANLIVKLR
ncbi:MAG: acyl carrier protein [Opitutaceae bacterium]|nr:acyl carrier protein [Opitutaceae bacterium]